MQINNSLLVNTLSIQTTSYESTRMERYIKRFLNKHKIQNHVDAYGNIYAVKGKADLYPTMVCHIDTVHDINMNSIVKRHQDTLYSIDTKTFQRTGIGGDDKVGVYITLELLLAFNDFKAVFFKDEEVGCIGSGQADMSFFDDSTVVLQCDRQGYGDFVTDIYGIELTSDEFLDAINPILLAYERTPCSGGLTDVKSIATKNDVVVANVNCGYYFPHTDDEIVNVFDVELTLNFCLEVFASTMNKRWTMKRTVTTPYKSNKKKWDSYYDSFYDYGDFNWEQDTYVEGSGTASQAPIATDCICNDDSQLVYDPYEDDHYCTSCHYYLGEKRLENTYISKINEPNINPSNEKK